MTVTETPAAPAADPTTVDEILAAVGDDAGRAGAYLERERAAEKPRVTLVAKLEEIAGVPAGADELVEVELLGVSHGGLPGERRTTDRESALELQRSGLVRVLD